MKFMTIAYKKRQCAKYFEELKDILKDTYSSIESCNKDISAYLVKNGTEREITYFSKPECSFRISDHWNWYSNIKKCPDEKYVQCDSISIPKARKRKEKGKASDPIKAIQVSFFYNGKYHVVFGEFFNFEKRTWEWLESDVNDIALLLKCNPENLTNICPSKRLYA